MSRYFLALGVGALAGAAAFMPVYEVSPLPFIAPAERPVRVLFVGDLMLDRNVGASAEAEGVEALFATSTRALFAGADVRVANLEGTITTKPSIARVNNKILRFTFSPDVAKQTLELLQLSAVSLANNHSLDFGADGYTETRNRVEALGIGVFGHPYNAAGSLSTVFDVDGKKLCLVGFHSLYDAATAGVVDEITALRPYCWRILVMAHWGSEYQTRSNTAQQAAGRRFIDAGADIIIGAHPHVVQEVETYKGKAIFYSLGNFMFDQNFSSATMRGLAVRADFYEDKTSFILTPLVIAQQHSSVATSTVADFTLP